jgi:hypothetical protein
VIVFGVGSHAVTLRGNDRVACRHVAQQRVGMAFTRFSMPTHGCAV